MSDTPRTDAHTRQLIDALQHPHWIEFARKLERENATLRADLLIEEERSIYWRDNENKAMAENAALRALLSEPYSFFTFGHKALSPWGKALDNWCERAKPLLEKKEA